MSSFHDLWVIRNNIPETEAALNYNITQRWIIRVTSSGLLSQGYCERKTHKSWKDHSSFLSVLLLILQLSFSSSSKVSLSRVHDFIWWCIFRPTQIRYTSLVTCAKSAMILRHDLLARGFTAARLTCGRSARPRTCPNLTLK